ncbi:MAG: hypothetical protein Q9167_004525 [Letrouitia subvulpina]
MHPNLAFGVAFAIQQYLCPFGGPCKWFTSQPAAHKINLPWATVAVPSVPGATVPIPSVPMPSVVTQTTTTTMFALPRTEKVTTTATVTVAPQDLDMDDTTTTRTRTTPADSTATPSSEASEEEDEPAQAASAPSFFEEYFAVLLCLVPLLLLGCLPSRRRHIDAEACYHDLVKRIEDAAHQAAWENWTSQYWEMDSLLQQTRDIADSRIKGFLDFVRNALTSLDKAESKLQAWGMEKQRLEDLLAKANSKISRLGKEGSGHSARASRLSQENRELRSSRDMAERRANELEAEVRRQKEELRRRRVGAHDFKGKIFESSSTLPESQPESQPQPAKTPVKAIFQRESMHRETKEKLATATKDITALEQEVSDRKEQLAVANKNVEDLKSEKLALGQDKDKQLQDLDAELQLAKQELQELGANTAAVITQLEKKAKDNEASAQEDVNALRKGHEAEKIRLGDEKRAAEALRDSAMEQIQRLESEKKALADEKENKTQALEAEVISARDRAKEVQDEMAGKEKELAATKISLDKARAAVESRETTDKGTTTDDTTITIDTADAEKVALQQQLDQANQEKSALVQQLNQSVQDHSSTLQQLNQCRAAHDSLVGQVSQLQQSQLAMGEGVEQLRRELAQAQTDKDGLYEQAKKEFDQMQEVRDGEIRDLQGQIQGLRNDLEHCQQHGAKLEEEKRELAEKNEELTTRNDELQCDVALWQEFAGVTPANELVGQPEAPSQSLEGGFGEAVQQETLAPSASAIGGNGEFNFNTPPLPIPSFGAQSSTAPASDPSARPATPVFSSLPGLFTGQTLPPDQSNQPIGQGIARAYNIPRSRRPRTIPRITAAGSSSVLPPPAPQPPTPGQGSQAKREADPEDHYTQTVVGVRQPLSQQQFEDIDPEYTAMGFNEEDLREIAAFIASPASGESSQPANRETVDPYREYPASEFEQFNPMLRSGPNPATAAAQDLPASGADNEPLPPLHLDPVLIDPALLEPAIPIDPALLAPNQPPAPILNTPASPPDSEQMSAGSPRSPSPEKADLERESSSSSEAD